MHRVSTTLSKSIGSTRIYSNPSRLQHIDLDVFKDATSECKPPRDDDLITECCSSIKRLCISSRYFDVLNKSKTHEKEMEALFVEFNQEIYQLVVDDTAHLAKKHCNDLQRIHSEWTAEYGFTSCHLSKCDKSWRHYKRNDSKDHDENRDGLYSIYESLFDRVHNFVFHLYDIGLRVDESKFIEDSGGDENEDILKGMTIDKLFKAERNTIRVQRGQCNMDMDRYNEEINKYTIQSIDKIKTKITLIDAMIQGLLTKMKMDREDVERMMKYFHQNGYDSDGIEEDTKDINHSNTCKLIKNERAVQWINTFIRSINCMPYLSMLCYVSPLDRQTLTYIVPLQCDARRSPPVTFSIIGRRCQL